MRVPYWKRRYAGWSTAWRICTESGSSFCRCWRQIHFSESDHLYILGDVIDRGPDGVELLLQIMASPNMTMLLGNHEQMCLSTLGPRNKLGARELWRQNGGSTNLSGTALPSHTAGAEPHFCNISPACRIIWNVRWVGREFYLVHGCPGNDHDTRIWGRVELDSVSPYPDTVCIVGHTPTVILTKQMNGDFSNLARKGDC